jgi:hypothetical protein
MSNAPVLTIHAPGNGLNYWSVSGDLREIVDFEDDSTNYLVTDALRASDTHYNLDSEYSCFFGYGSTEGVVTAIRDAALAAVGVVITEQIERHPVFAALSPEARATIARNAVRDALHGVQS